MLRPISTILILTGLLLAVAVPSRAAKTPAVPVPANRWGTLQPAGILGDSTSFEGHSEPTQGKVREYHDVDVENGYLFTATGQGMAIYDLRANPTPGFAVSYLFGWITGGAFPVWNFSDKDWFVKEIDAPAGFDGLVALGMEEQGFAVVNTANKSAPVVAYQGAVDVSRVFAFTSGASHFAYAVARSGGKIHRFSLSAAAGMTRCVEAPPAISCPGVYLGEVASFGTGNRDVQGMGGFVVTSRGGAAGSARIYSIADPAAPVLRLEIPGGTLAAVLWQQGSSFFVARLTQNGQLLIHDVSCIAGGACASAPVVAALAPTAPKALAYLEVSLDGGRAYLYVGDDDLGSCVDQREYLYGLSNPASPQELTPHNPAGPYWGWYYMGCPTGFNLVGPRRGVVYKDRLYRAAFSILDAHKLQTGPVAAHVDSVTASPLAPKVCQPVTFTANGVFGTQPLAIAWLLESGGVPVPGVLSTTETLVWNTTAATPPGSYKATVTVTNAFGSDMKNASVTLAALPALPAAGSFAPTTDPFTGGTVQFHVAAAGATAWNWDFDGDGVFNEADWTSDPVAGPNPAFTYPAPGLRQVKVKVRNCVSPAGVVSAAVPVNVVGGKIVVNGPDVGQPGQAIQFAGVGVDGCNPPAASGWTWTATGISLAAQQGSTVTISWPTLGVKTVTAKNSACPGITGTRQVTIKQLPKACFNSSPPVKLTAQQVSFDASCSTGSPTSYAWDFGDSTPLGSGVQVFHTYANQGTYQVTLSVTRAGGDCPPAPFCENSKTDSIEVGPVVPALVAKFGTSAACATEAQCDAVAGQAVTFTDQSAGSPATWSWNFGDGSTASGPAATHAFAKAGSFTVTLTVVGPGSSSDTASKTFKVVQPPSPVVLPWVARSRGTMVQTSDLYVHNPGAAPMTVSLVLRRRGLPETNPPQALRTVAPGATLYAADVIKSLFGRDENLSGLVLVTPAQGSPQPVITSQQTSGPVGSAFGLAVQGRSVPSTPGAGLQLVGMNDSANRASFFGVSNPTDAPATYRLRFFNAAGQAIGTPSGDLTLSRFGQKQFQLAEVRSLFGVTNQEDYRISVESSTGPLLPYGVDVWTSTNDPSLVGNGPGGTGRAWLIGVSNKPGADGSTWKTDAVLSNTTGQALAVNLAFTPLGVAGTPTAPSHVSLSPGTTLRLDDVLKKQWSLTNAVGVISIDSDPAGGVLPSAFGEAYRSPLMGKRYGHSMPVLSAADAAGPGEICTLVGLRQDSVSRTTVWVLNAGTETGDYDVVYRGLDGVELGRIAVRLAPGKVRQLNPAQHPLPDAGVADGFTIEIVVRAGKVLAAAQGVSSATNDSTYIYGVTQ